MRNNIPTDDFSVTQPVTDDPPESKLTKEQKELAKVGNSANWKIITDYLDSRIEAYKKGLFGEDLSGKPAEVIGNRFLAAQSVIQEFEALKAEVETTTKAVKDATSEAAGA